MHESREDIESYLMKIGLPYEQLSARRLWNVKAGGQREPAGLDRRTGGGLPHQGHGPAARDAGAALRDAADASTPPRWCTAPSASRADTVVIIDALELENLDFNEFQAVIDDISMAVSKHYPDLSKFRAAA